MYIVIIERNIVDFMNEKASFSTQYPMFYLMFYGSREKENNKRA